MIITVCWISYEPGTLYRGHWDEALIEDIFSRDAWRPAGGVEFDHCHVDSPDSDWPDVDGLVAVVPGRHNARHIDQLALDLNQYRWVILVVTGDEEGIWPYAQFFHPNLRVWGMARPRHAAHIDTAIGSGYSPGFPALVQANPTPAPGRLDVFFCGQDTHIRRHDAIAAARLSVPIDRRLIVTTTEFLADGSEAKGGMTREDYAWALADCKIAPCPSGPESVDSFRLYEALEAGAVPVADGMSPTDGMGDYWEFVFGGPVPFLVMDDWQPLPAVVETLLRGWPGNAAHVSAWWQQHKRRLVYRMENDVRELTGTHPDYTLPDDQITVVIPTCPIPSHPETWMIEEVVESIRVQLPRAEIIVVCDGVRPTMEHHRAAYDEFLFRLTRLCQGWSNVVPMILPEWRHQAGATREALRYVTTPLILFAEHDTPLTGEIDWPGLCRIVTDGVVNMVRLHHETAIGPDHVHMALDKTELHVGKSDEHPDGVPIVRTVQWSQRPHLATAQFYRERIMPLFPVGGVSTYIEWITHGTVVHGIEDGLAAQWEKWKVAIYYPPGGNIQRSLHLDGRAGASTEDSIEAFKAMRENG